MGKTSDIQTVAASLYFLPLKTRVPLKFGAEVFTEVACARAGVTVVDRQGRRATGWGETPLNAQWAWPSQLPLEQRADLLRKFTIELAGLWSAVKLPGHPLEISSEFQESVLPGFLQGFNYSHSRGREPLPWLAGLLCCAPFDIALHDAYGRLLERPVYATYSAEFMNRDLAAWLAPAQRSQVSFNRRFPADFFVHPAPTSLPAWHTVGGLDPLTSSDLTDPTPDDGHPLLLEDWIKRDGLTCLKIKLAGRDESADFERVRRIATIAGANGVNWLSLDYNATVTEPGIVNRLLDRLRDEFPRAYGMLLFVEQPFPEDLARHPFDVHGVSARKPLFLDESARDWRHVRLGREMGWTGVALKTCKTQTGAVLAGCWAKAHQMGLMVSDLTNPMLAQIAHVQLAANFGTIMGIETNSMQFYPDASRPEAEIHPGLYRRSAGRLDLSSIRGAGFGYRLEEIRRELPAPAAEFKS